MMSKLAKCLVVPALALMTGCAGLSFQSYGSNSRGHNISEGAMRPDVIASMGEPDSIYKSADMEAFFYKNYKGTSIFGIVNTMKRTDVVVVMDTAGSVRSVLPVEMGVGRSYFSSPLLGATYPVPGSELFEGPENYSHENEGQ